MRKLYHHLLTALLAFAGTTSALAQADGWSGKAIKYVGEATTSLDQLTDGGFYLMRNVGRKNFINEASDGQLLLGNKTESPSGSILTTALHGPWSMNYVVKLVKITEGDNAGKYIVQVQSGKYIGILPRTDAMYSQTEAEPFAIGKFAQGTDAFYLAGTSNAYWLNGNAGTLTGYYADNASSDGNNNAGYQFWPVTLDNYSNLSIDANSFYKIWSSRSDKPLTDISLYRWISSASQTANTNGDLEVGESGSRNIYRVQGTAAIVPMLWQFEGDNTNGYKIRNANTGTCWGQIKGYADIELLATGVDESYAGLYTISNIEGSSEQWFIKDKEGNKFVNALRNIYEQEGLTYGIGDWDGNDANDQGNHWYIERVTEIPLAITAAKWASATYPFGVQLPEALTAYVATSVDGAKSSVTLTAIGQAIPANTPVFITLDENGTAGNYTATIDNSISALNGQTNLLSGSTARRSGFEESTIYGLAAGTDGATLKLNAEAAVPANKAYLQASEVNGSNVQTLHFSFGDVTGIGGITTGDSQQADDTYYDLSGRRVLYPAHGVFVKANGQKVYIK